MTWTEYAHLIEHLDTDPANWRSAAEGNPNTPHDALVLAVKESSASDVASLIHVLILSVDDVPVHAIANLIAMLAARLPEGDKDAEEIELAPLCDQPSFPHDADYAAYVHELLVIENAVTAHDATLDYVEEFDVPYNFAWAAIKHILEQETK